MLLSGVHCYAQGIIATIAGKDVAFTGDGTPAINVPLGVMVGVVTDSNGNIYSSDQENHMVVRTGTDGILHVFAGNGIPGYSGDGGPATRASLNGPLALAIDGAGNIYVAESFSHRIRKITPAGIISTFAGSGRPTTSGDGGPATLAGIGEEIYGMIFDAAGNLYFSQLDENVVRKIDTNGIITTAVGTGQPGFSGDGGPPNQATLAGPYGVAFDPKGNLLIADAGNLRIRSVSPTGTIVTIGGGGFFPTDGISASTAFILPLGITADAAGNVYLSDYFSARVRRIDTTGTISTVAGSGVRGFSGDGGPALAASLAAPTGLTVDRSGNILFADFSVARIRRISAGGVIVTVAGNGQYKPSPDGLAGTDTPIRSPWEITTVADGSIVFAERTGGRIRRVGPDGTVSTVAGTGVQGITGDGGKAVAAQLSLPDGVAVDASGDVYFTEETNFKVREVSPAGIISTEAGNGLISPIAVNGVPATETALAIPKGIALDAAGNLYLADGGPDVIRKISTSGIITSVAGNGSAGFSGDGGPATAASLRSPSAVAVDAAGNLYISDRANFRIRKVTPDGTISTIAGIGQGSYSGEGGPASKAALSPNGLALDSAGNLFIADPDNNRVLKINQAGVISTIAGNGQAGSAGDGGLATLASLNTPQGVAVDAKGNVYISDSGNGRVRVVLAAPATFSVSSNALSFTGKSTGAVSASQTVQITGSLAGLPFMVTQATTSGGAWLQTSLQNGTMPYGLGITADPSGLQPGSYQGTVTITAAGAQPSVQTIAVTFNVTTADPPSLSVNSGALTFSLTQGQPPATRVVVVANSGGGSLAVTSTVSTAAGGAWLSAAPAQSTATANVPATLTVSADPTGLAAGTYLGQITVSGSTGQNVVVPATLIVSPLKQKLLLTTAGFTFQAVAGGGVIPPQSFGIANVGNGVLNWTAAAGPPWLTLSTASGSSDSAATTVPQVSLTANTGSLAPGTYYDKVTVSAPQADNAPQLVSTVLNVLPAGSSPTPVVQPAGLVFTAVAGGVSPGSQTVTVYNPGAATLTYNSSRLTLDGNDWFVHLPASGTVTPQTPVQIVVQPNVTGLAAGVYSGLITLLFSNQAVQTVNLLFVVSPAASSGSARPNSLRRLDSSTCTPTKLAPLFTSFSSNFVAPAGWPVPIQVQVVDDCGSSLTSGSVSVTFSNGDPVQVLSSVSPGSWAGTWTPRSAQSSTLIMTAKAQSDSGLTGQTQLSAQSQQNTGVPLLQPSAIVNAAWPAAPVPLAPGSLVSLYGVGLATATQSAAGFPLPVAIAGTSVIMAGRELPLLYTSNGQVNTMIPYDMGFNTRQQLIVQSGGELTTPELVSIAAAQPVIFASSGYAGGQGRIYVTTSGLQILADNNNPATAGDQVLIEASGLGAVTPAFDSSQVPTAPLPATLNPVTVTIGGVSVPVVSATLSPAVPGLYYVYITMPAGIAAGSAVPVILSAAGESSPVTTMAVQ